VRRSYDRRFEEELVDELSRQRVSFEKMQKMSPIKRTYTGEDKSDADRTILTDNPRRSSDYYSIRQKKNFKSIQQI
jgi:hypothetical protein